MANIVISRSYIWIKSQPARMRCGKFDWTDEDVWEFLSQPARMRCGKFPPSAGDIVSVTSQPARMRCGKYPDRAGYRSETRVATRANALWQICPEGLQSGCCTVATRANALWQIRRCGLKKRGDAGRNPRECAVAKVNLSMLNSFHTVATRANALWQRLPCCVGANP